MDKLDIGFIPWNYPAFEFLWLAVRGEVVAPHYGSTRLSPEGYQDDSH